MRQALRRPRLMAAAALAAGAVCAAAGCSARAAGAGGSAPVPVPLPSTSPAAQASAAASSVLLQAVSVLHADQTALLSGALLGAQRDAHAARKVATTALNDYTAALSHSCSASTSALTASLAGLSASAGRFAEALSAAAPLKARLAEDVARVSDAARAAEVSQHPDVTGTLGQFDAIVSDAAAAAAAVPDLRARQAKALGRCNSKALRIHH